ncbi:MAG: hypothetical protein ACLTTU_03640 [Bilophila wadsworthia]
MAKELKKVNVVTVGVGFTGGIALAECAKAGLSVVGLERGDRRGVRISGYHDEWQYAVVGLCGSVQRDDYVPQYGRNASSTQARLFPCSATALAVQAHWNGMNFVSRPMTSDKDHDG